MTDSKLLPFEPVKVSSQGAIQHEVRFDASSYRESVSLVALHALIGVYSTNSNPNGLAHRAWEYADAMDAERKAREAPKSSGET